MAEGQRNRHFILDGVTETERFSRSGRGSRPIVPRRDRHSHAAALRGQIDDLRIVANESRAEQEELGLEGGIGIQVEFQSFPDVELAAERLARDRSGIELLRVRQDDASQRTYATVFVPDGRLGHFEQLLQNYVDERRNSAGWARDNRLLIDAIEQIRSATLRALWTDEDDELPDDEQAPFWWEVWLPVRDNRNAVVADFRRSIGFLDSRSPRTREFEERDDVQRYPLDSMAPRRDAETPSPRIADGELRFPERTVLLVHATIEQMQDSMLVLNNVAELRQAKSTAEFFDSLTASEQSEWVSDLLARTTFAQPAPTVPHVCLLDTGVNRGHPLLAPALDAADLHTVDPNLGVEDAHGHGTEMAGLALLGDLTELLDSTEAVSAEHRLESVKLLAADYTTGSDPKHHGYLTQEAVARAELAAPHRRRILGMAVTASGNQDRGQPSAWSAAIDTLAADADAQGENRRLMVISAGNARRSSLASYPDGNDTDGIQDPAQAWNALVVGAYTQLTNITEDNTRHYSPVAPEGGLSPFSTTSVTWQSQWPLKPDIVMEGGNAAQDCLGADEMPSLSLLTTYYRPEDRLLTHSNATSAATALASRLAAQVTAVYPELWPETIRALIVHSADWTETMKRTYLPSRHATKEDYARLIRRCGFGVPDLDRAVHSVADSLTMVVQQTLTPFKRDSGRAPGLRDMHLHRLPWPTETLESLGELPVEMRVTLSYFIEPNPSRRGRSRRYAYESHGLRFDVRRPTESVVEFRKRINAAARAEDDGRQPTSSDPHWLIGPQNRHKGSLHGDIWRGTATDLASRDCIAIYPASGWWKTRPALERYGLPAPYALVVSIKAPEADVDLYTEVASRVNALVEVET